MPAALLGGFLSHRGGKSYPTEESSTSTIICDFDTAVISVGGDPVKLFADQIFREFATGNVVRRDAVVPRSPASRV